MREASETTGQEIRHGTAQGPARDHTDREKRVAIVVQRCHESVVGGAESLAWQYAQFLKDEYSVDVITSCAADANSWRNIFPAGPSEREGVRILRFESRPGHSSYWHRLNEILAHHHRVFAFRRRRAVGARSENAMPGVFDPARMIPWTRALQREWIQAQGPYSPALLDYIHEHRDAYRVFIFVTYLFAPTAFGLGLVDRSRRILVPALHDEAPAYLPIYKELARNAGRIFWNTRAEAELGRRIWGAGLNGAVVSMGVEAAAPATELRKKSPRILYLLYCGRIDPGKGCDRLFRYFRLFQNQHPGPLKLLLTGNLQMKLPSPRPNIKHLGFVSDAEKLRLMADARAVVIPSPHESLSLITLEAMGQGTPVFAYGRNPVLREHVEASEGGLLFSDYESFRVNLGRILGTPGLREKLGAGGRRYVSENFETSVVRKRLLAEIASAPFAAPVDPARAASGAEIFGEAID
ncbi:MAG: glycosyltransferase family 4 protein [bacterium]|nr:glycosyltransferase family 4 protein [bacterium]